MSPESKGLAPVGTLVEVTVWCVEPSSLVQVTVAFTPMTTVTLSGEYPGAPFGLPAPAGIEIAVTELGPVEVVVVEDVAPPGKVYETSVAIPLTRKYPRRIGMMMAINPTTPSVSFGGA